MAFFRKKTIYTTEPNKYNAIIIGRKTRDSLPNKLLAKRVNIVISSMIKPTCLTETCVNTIQPVFFTTLDSALEFCDSIDLIETVFVIGGEHLYNYCLQNAIDKLNEVYWTTIMGVFDCDCFFRPPLLEYFMIASHKKRLI